MAEFKGALQPGSSGQYRALVLDSTYRPIDVSSPTGNAFKA